MPFETVVGDEVEDVQTHQQIIIDHHIRVIVSASASFFPLHVGSLFYIRGRQFGLYLHRTYGDTVYVDISDDLKKDQARLARLLIPSMTPKIESSTDS